MHRYGRWLVLWAGIFGVASAAAAQGAPARWSLQPELTTGARDGGPGALTEVSDVLVGPEGEIYVAQPRERQVRVFSRTGAFLRSMGRRGDGPGELTDPRFLGWHGDTVVVADPRSQRIVGFGRSGTHAFTRSFAAMEQFKPRVLLSTGKVLGNRQVFQDDVASGAVTHEELSLAAYPARGREPYARLPIGRSSGTASYVGSRGPANVVMLRPFHESTLYDHDPRGQGLVTLARSSPANRQRGQFTLTRRSSTGGIVWRRTASYRPVRISRSVMEDTARKYIGEIMQMERTDDSSVRASVSAAVREAIGDVAYLPGAVDVVAGHDGRAWVRVGSTGPRVTWMVFDRWGRHVANVSAPSEMSLMAADARHVWGVVLNADDVPFVVRYRITG